MKETLTPRQEKFCLEIVAGNTQSQAYRAAYNAKNMKASTINNKAYRLMKKGEIRARVEGLRRPVVQAIQKSRIEWLHQIQHTAFFDIRELFDGNGSIKDLSQIGPEHLPAIAGMEVFEEFSGTGAQRQKIGVTKKLKLTDRLHALELFGKATGFLNVKEQPVSPLEGFGADVLLAMREELCQRIAARKGLNNQGGINDRHRSCPETPRQAT
jgi:phage terminase small subunit